MPTIESPASAPSRDLPLDGLRGLAALVVFVAHFTGAFGPLSIGARALAWLLDPTAAVMIFFVLSGYVVGLVTPGPGTAVAVRAFVWRRAVRLWPIYFVGVLLGCALATTNDPLLALGNFLCLQNTNDYFGFYVPLLPSNFNLWSLNYEVLYYAVFALLWWRGVRLSPAIAGTAVLALAAWFGPASGVFLACYASGFLFWLGGLALARHGQPALRSTHWPSWLLLALATWKLHPVQDLLFALPLPKPYFAGPAVRLYQLDFLPVALVLIAAVAQRSLPGQRRWEAAAALIPAVGLAAMCWRDGDGAIAALWPVGALCGAAVLLGRWRPSLRIFSRAAPLGLIAYALYATARPIQEFFLRHRTTAPVGATSLALEAVLATALCFAVAWYLELRLQPALKRALCPRELKR